MGKAYTTLKGIKSIKVDDSPEEPETCEGAG